jgi:hypothetical protein
MSHGVDHLTVRQGRDPFATATHDGYKVSVYLLNGCRNGGGICQWNPLQTTSEHCLPLWGMKPTVLDHHNLADLHALTLTH